jgi:hypothetical protein
MAPIHPATFTQTASNFLSGLNPIRLFQFLNNSKNCTLFGVCHELGGFTQTDPNLVLVSKASLPAFNKSLPFRQESTSIFDDFNIQSHSNPFRLVVINSFTPGLLYPSTLEIISSPPPPHPPTPPLPLVGIVGIISYSQVRLAAS